MFDQIKSAVAEKPEHDFRGEEGLLYRVQLPMAGQDGLSETYWAKKWHRSHVKPFYLPFESGGSSLSPFWHKVIETSYRIVHELFPQETIDVCGAYDERVSGTLSGLQSFDVRAGKPVTVSRDIIGDPEICNARNDVINKYYKVLLERRDEGARAGATKAEMAPFFAEWRKIVNVEIVKVLGPEVELDSIISTMPPGSNGLDYIAKLLRKRNPENVMSDFFEAGISIGHPEVNFIPGRKDAHPRPPHGTFVEFSIVDVDKLVGVIMRRFADNPRKKNQLLQEVRTYQIYDLVDRMFDRVLLIYIQKTEYKPKPESFGKVCETLEKLRQIMERYGDVIEPEVFLTAVERAILRAISHQDMIARLQREVILPMKNYLTQ